MGSHIFRISGIRKFDFCGKQGFKNRTIRGQKRLKMGSIIGHRMG